MPDFTHIGVVVPLTSAKFGEAMTVSVFVLETKFEN